MSQSRARVGQVLDALEDLYGPQKAAGPTDPYEMILLSADYRDAREILRAGLPESFEHATLCVRTS
jgi:hypothetical protein